MKANLPPKQVLFNDPKHTEYDYWDLMLLKAYHFCEDYIRDGVPIWWDESDEVFFEAEPRISKSNAATRRAEEVENQGDRKSPPGRYFIPIPKTRGGRAMPTFSDWLKEQEKKSKGRK